MHASRGESNCSLCFLQDGLLEDLWEGKRSILGKCVDTTAFPVEPLNSLLALCLVTHYDCQIAVVGLEYDIRAYSKDHKRIIRLTSLKKLVVKRPEQQCLEDAIARIPNRMAEHVTQLMRQSDQEADLDVGVDAIADGADQGASAASGEDVGAIANEEVDMRTAASRPGKFWSWYI